MSYEITEQNLVTIIVALISFIGSILLLCGGLVVHIFKKHECANDADAAHNREEFGKLHARIDEHIRDHLNKRK